MLQVPLASVTGVTNPSAAGLPAPTFGNEIPGRDVRRFALFLCVGLVGLGVDASLFSCLHASGASRALARAVSLAAATGVTWRLNRRFTFAATGRLARAELGRYALVTLVAQGTSYGTFLALSQIAPSAPPLALLVTGAALATGLSFAGQRLFTFRAAP